MIPNFHPGGKPSYAKAPKCFRVICVFEQALASSLN